MESNYKSYYEKLSYQVKRVRKVPQTHLNNILSTYFTMKNAGAVIKI